MPLDLIYSSFILRISNGVKEIAAKIAEDLNSMQYDVGLPPLVDIDHEQVLFQQRKHRSLISGQIDGIISNKQNIWCPSLPTKISHMTLANFSCRFGDIKLSAPAKITVIPAFLYYPDLYQPLWEGAFKSLHVARKFKA